MRTIGFVLIFLGGFIAYLGYHGKVGQAFQAIKSGTVPTVSFTPHSKTVVNDIADSSGTAPTNDGTGAGMIG